MIGIPTTDSLQENRSPGQKRTWPKPKPSLKDFWHRLMEIKKDWDPLQFQWEGRENLEVRKRVNVDKVKGFLSVKPKQHQAAQHKEHRILESVSNLATSSRRKRDFPEKHAIQHRWRPTGLRAHRDGMDLVAFSRQRL